MYTIGDKVVYPVHGAGVIEAIEEKEILGELRRYYIMKMPLDDMKVMIPLDGMDQIGIREIINQREVELVFAVLSAQITEMSANWNKRYRANMDRIKTGDVFEVAEVVRNLTLKDREKALSTGERKIMQNAKQVLLSELILATGRSKEDLLTEIEVLIE
ncbi:CarD family transcriptional regulator [Isachenkonia alkalipeptolytica]|uniref:CarD family transcriptional regulator n=1 Tax=Isachenkonia alkalipeptolytica TaxID=2565777 RepID=A0AA43XLK2_9CLOT|nr:CarD family transcriptional regulator [Isachenkonia alkalipeptolytica]NBG89043.1 CarD family transcriptional regulator [Isachenkonia alkalipeptolytica]